MAKIQRLGFQAMPKNSLFPVRALRMVDDTEDSEKDLLISTRPIGDRSTLVAVVDSFKREFPRGKVEVELPESCEIRAFRPADMAWLFA
jgi:hypothetical protein